MTSAIPFQAGELVHQIRLALFPLSFIWCVIGLWDAVWKQGVEVKTLLGSIFRVLAVAVLVWQYPVLIKEGQNALYGFRDNIFTESENKFQQLLSAQIVNGPGSMDFAGQMCSVFVHALKGLGNLMLSILRFLQTFCLEVLIAFSPILIGFLGWDLTRSVGIQFCFTSLGILLWEVGVLIIDVLLLGLGDEFLKPEHLRGVVTLGTAGVITAVASWPLFLGIIVMTALLPAFLYLSVPFIIAAVLRGCDPTGPLLLKAMQMASTGISGGLGALARIPVNSGLASGLSKMPRGGDGGSSLSTSESRPTASSETGRPPPLAAFQPGGDRGPAGGLLSPPGPDHFSPLQGDGGGRAFPAQTSESVPGGAGLSMPLSLAFSKNSAEQQGSESMGSSSGEVYIGRKGHIFRRLNDTQFSCTHPRTGFTSEHEGNVSSKEVRNSSLFHHNQARAKAHNMRRPGRSKETVS